MNCSSVGTSHTWGSTRVVNNHKKNSGDLQSCIDVGQIMEKIQRDNYIRQQKSIEHTEDVSKKLMNWREESESDMKSLENQMELLKKRKEQIRQNSTEMTILMSQLRHKLEKVREEKNKNYQFFEEGEEMQT